MTWEKVHNKMTDKPKGKRRKLRDYAEKSARGEQPEVWQGPLADGTDSKSFLPGGCIPFTCGAEAACYPSKDGLQHLCLCTTNGKTITDDAECPRSTVPLTPKPIRNIILPRTSNNSAESRYGLSPSAAPNSQGSEEKFGEPAAHSDFSVSSPVNTSSGVLWAAVAVGSLLCVALVVTILVVWYFRKRMCAVSGKAQPRVRPGEPLLAERYITNPQYGLCGADIMATTPSPGSPGAAGKVNNKDSTLQVLERTALTFLEEVGEGCFGKVHKGLLRDSTGEQVVAIKVLKETTGRNAEEDFSREVSIMSAFRHINILSLIGVVYRDDINASPWMIFEYMEWGDLAGVLRGSKGGGRPGPPLNEPALLHVALQVARGMQYLASRRFVHRDLAARNCLVGSHLTVKIADFGMSRDVYTCDYYKMGGERPMPVRWMSPESIVYARFTHESDVWSFGVVLWEIYSRGKQPFYGYSNVEASKIILQGIMLIPPTDCPRFACELMRECWRSDPRDRIGFDEICSKLETAHAADNVSNQIRLPRPPPPPQDSAGYLVPAIRPPVDYVIPIPEPDSESSEEEEDDDEYT